jgi:hypothetical protein
MPAARSFVRLSPISGRDQRSHSCARRRPPYRLYVFDVLSSIGAVMVVVILAAVVRFGWSLFRGTPQLDDPGGSTGPQIFGGPKAERPEDWLKK